MTSAVSNGRSNHSECFSAGPNTGRCVQTFQPQAAARGTMDGSILELNPLSSPKSICPSVLVSPTIRVGIDPSEHPSTSSPISGRKSSALRCIPRISDPHVVNSQAMLDKPPTESVEASHNSCPTALPTLRAEFGRLPRRGLPCGDLG